MKSAFETQEIKQQGRRRKSMQRSYCERNLEMKVQKLKLK